MWPTVNDITYYKRIGKLEEDDTYVADMLPLLLEHINSECVVEFTAPDLPANVKLFLAQSLAFFSAAQPGLESEKMGSVSFSYNFKELPVALKDLLSQYGYGRKRSGARFHVL